ncbi:UNVERIFIED_CONTAM: hypothetical protein Slati_0407200 [Sesamum latifolium]|uniref:Uncharacterized protein n=1 Tax=Sesamum latifolium TaxID=2727402 RepID=A0AAW2Y029_9LAMI
MLIQRYCPNSDILQSEAVVGSSFTWRSFIATHELILAGSRWHIGTGQSVKIWGDRWIPRPLTFQVLSPPNTLQSNATVALLLDENGVWNEELIRGVFWPDDVDAILALIASFVKGSYFLAMLSRRDLRLISLLIGALFGRLRCRRRLECLCSELAEIPHPLLPISLGGECRLLVFVHGAVWRMKICCILWYGVTSPALSGLFLTFHGEDFLVNIPTRKHGFEGCSIVLEHQILLAYCLFAGFYGGHAINCYLRIHLFRLQAFWIGSEDGSLLCLALLAA